MRTTYDAGVALLDTLRADQERREAMDAVARENDLGERQDVLRHANGTSVIHDYAGGFIARCEVCRAEEIYHTREGDEPGRCKVIAARFASDHDHEGEG